jgi:adenosine deaminase
MNILVCTLGASWPVIPEVFGFLAPSCVDLYAHHPQRARLDALRRKYALDEPHELWVCTTEGAQTARSLQYLHDWWQCVGASVPLRIWSAQATDQLATQAECDHIRELTLRVVLRASECAGRDGQIVLSLAGGRKTMSADLQWAGTLFGAQALLHVVGPDPLPEEIARGATPALFASPLPAALAGAVAPLVVGQAPRNELIDIGIDGRRVDSASYPLPEAAPHCRWAVPNEGCALTAEIERRQREGSRLLGNFLVHLGETEHHENWRSLYRLAPAHIEHLRATPLDRAHAGWLEALPKADLHRHLGGCLDLAQQRAVGRAVWDALEPAARAAALARAAPLLRNEAQWPWEWPQALREGDRAANCAAVLMEASDQQLECNLYAASGPRVALKGSEHGFAAYERPGELTGSAILTHPAAIAAYANALVKQARAEGLAYVELRGSPHKYADAPAAFLRALRAVLARAGASCGEDCGGTPNDRDAPRFAFVWILDRRQRDRVEEVIAQAVAAHAELEGFLVGLDLAGDEGTHGPEALAAHFTPAFRECLPITIHAGEGEPAENIWQAAYHLHADRIGHGLTLSDDAKLQGRFRDRGICLELCPTSNREVVGFRDPAFPESMSLPAYPLRDFIAAGLPLTLCTDNPGISRTTLAGEYLAAARMSEGGLTLWEALAMIRQGFVHAFVASGERERLLKRADQRIYELMTTGGVWAASLREHNAREHCGTMRRPTAMRRA